MKLRPVPITLLARCVPALTTLFPFQLCWSCAYSDLFAPPFHSCHYNLVEVSWYIGIFTRLSRWKPGFDSHNRRGTFVLQQGNLSTLLLSTQVYKWGPGRRWQIIVFEFASAIIGCSARNAPCGVEIVHCKCGIEMYPMTGVIIRCKRFGPHGKSAYKN